MLSRNYVSKILVVDLDVHKGNGAAKLFEENDSVFTFSMSGDSNYPLVKEKSDLDIPLKNDTTDEIYLPILKEVLPNLINSIKPNFIFYFSGVEILNTDKWEN